jgi:hypothetical protein
VSKDKTKEEASKARQFIIAPLNLVNLRILLYLLTSISYSHFPLVSRSTSVRSLFDLQILGAQDQMFFRPEDPPRQAMSSKGEIRRSQPLSAVSLPVPAQIEQSPVPIQRLHLPLPEHDLQVLFRIARSGITPSPWHTPQIPVPLQPEQFPVPLHFPHAIVGIIGSERAGKPLSKGSESPPDYNSINAGREVAIITT